MPTFNHLHCHTQFSLLDGAASIPNMYKKAAAEGMRGMAITDHGNMFGAFEFVAQAGKHDNAVKPIVGCEFYLVENRHIRQFSKDKKDRRYHQLFLAKNPQGYRNLVKMCSLGYIEGLYGKYPRIDKELVLQYHEGLIATTCCIGALVPQTILSKSEDEARKEFEWWLNIFGEDYYIELQRHEIKEQEIINRTLLKFAKEYNVKIIATNDSHYVDQEDANAHDILLCINTGEKQATPKMDDFTDDGAGMKNRRFAFPNNQFYLKTNAEMSRLFHDVPAAIDNTNEIVDKVEVLKLKRDILLPHFQIPTGYVDQDSYLRHLTMEGALARYKDITPEVQERIDFELFTIKTMGFAGYFLIVADFIKAGRDIGVFIGPGRGSAAGSAVAYCIGITNIDPIKYQLLFERFLNPDRKSMPDIDTDFDDEGREKVIDYVVQKYGQQQVAQIVTYSTMAAKVSIKDVARVMDLPLSEANILAKLVPDKPGIKLKRVMTAPITGEGSLSDKENLNNDDLENVKQLREMYERGGMTQAVLKEALILEGSVRGTGIHAAGIIIAPKDLTEIIPVYIAKDSPLYVTQFEGSIIEDAGVIKMDFLGLKTLTIMRDAIKMIRENHGVKIDIDEIPLDDKKTYELYQKGETNGTFQFESAGMQKYLKELKPDRFDDLIAMNALYRPGPLEYIPNYIARKHGTEKVVYDLAAMEEFLKDTYGITVYQEQVMLLSQKLAGFSKGDADVLRKAMGKKQIAVLNKMKTQFMDGCGQRGHDVKIAEKVWTDWEAFASYAFNKSHSTCYAFVAYQTAYLKTYYPAEYMAAVLTHNQQNLDKITFFMDECKRMGIPVLGPDINESSVTFAVNKKGEIRYALAAIKGVGEAAVEEMLAERKNNGAYKNLFDLTKRVSLRTVNKKTMESLAKAGAFDSFEGIHRAQYFFEPRPGEVNLLEKALKFGNQYQSSKNDTSFSLFGETSSADVVEPEVPFCPPWTLIERLSAEKEMIGIYLTGHPLDDYRLEIESLCNCTIEKIPDAKNREVTIGCMVTGIQIRTAKNGNSFGIIAIEDFMSTYEFSLFGNDFATWRGFFEVGNYLQIRAKYAPNWRGDDYELKVQGVNLLSELKDNTKKLTLLLQLQNISDDLVHQLDKLLMQHPGNIPLAVKVFDPATKYLVDMRSRTTRVSNSSDFYKKLRSLGVDAKVM